MANYSINWASFIGIILAIWGYVAVPLSIAQVVFILKKREKQTSQSIKNSLFIGPLAFGRFVGSQLVGGILFFQGWKLEPILQFGIFLLVLGLILESSRNILNDRRKWLKRKIVKE